MRGGCFLGFHVLLQPPQFADKGCRCQGDLTEKRKVSGCSHSERLGSLEAQIRLFRRPSSPCTPRGTKDARMIYCSYLRNTHAFTLEPAKYVKHAVMREKEQDSGWKSQIIPTLHADDKKTQDADGQEEKTLYVY